MEQDRVWTLIYYKLMAGGGLLRCRLSKAGQTDRLLEPDCQAPAGDKSLGAKLINVAIGVGCSSCYWGIALGLKLNTSFVTVLLAL